ncbi:MAG: ATP-binding protein [Terriglobia bacterium]
MPAPEPVRPEGSIARRRRRWLWRGLAFALLVGVVFILGSINVPFLQPNEPAEVILLYVFSTFVFLAFIIYGLVLVRYLVRLWLEHKRQVLGTKFKFKMVFGALALSLLPVLAMFFLGYSLVNRTLAKWFPRPLEIVRDDAVFIVQHLLREHEERAREQARLLAENSRLQEQLAERDVSSLQETLARLAQRHRLYGVAVVDPSGQPLALYAPAESRTRFLNKLPEILEPEPAALAYTTAERIAGSRFALARVRIENARGDPLGVLVVAQPLSAELLAKAEQIESESRAYDAIAQRRKSYRWQALLILLLITTLILLAATWSALTLSRQVTIPIQALAQATQEVSRGNFDHRVECPARDELGTLVTSFNQMTAQLGESRRHLEEAVAELNQRRQWMETILESVPTAVVTLSPDLRLLDANAAAERLLEGKTAPGSTLAGWMSQETTAACEELVARAAQAGFATRQMDLRLRDRIAHVAVSVSALQRNQGYVLVLDDLTDLLKAQKAAAWQEVAQRIAHEIKNPLTPIQLSADRIQRYLERAPEADPAERARYQGLIAQCATLIGQEVRGLKALVDEFSRFARFPRVQPVPTQLNLVVESTLALYRDSMNGIRLASALAADLPPIPADPDLLRRLLMNLIENASEALAEAPRKEIRVQTRYLPEQQSVELSVSDTGPGISAEQKERLFLPFFSSKPGGMGLGLAIVSRIVAEHHGTISVEDNPPSGACFRVRLPTQAPAVA